MSYGIIYKATNKINGKSYIGQTVREFRSRKLEHINKATKKISNFYFHNAIRKYGADDFKWSILCYCNNMKELNDKEVYYISKYNTFEAGYNMNMGGKGNSGWEVPKEIRSKISISKTGYKMLPRSKEWCNNISKAKMGGKLSKETIKKRTATRLKNNYVGENNWKSKKYVVITPKNISFVVDGLRNFCNIYEEDNLNYKVIHRAIRQNKIYKGYKCKYYDENVDANLLSWEIINAE